MAGRSNLPWTDLLSHLRARHQFVVRRWFDELQPGELSHGVLEVRAANSAQQRYLNDYCSRAFAEAARAVTGKLVTMRFTAPDGPAEDTHATPEDVWPPLAAASPWTALGRGCTFDRFVVGPCNRLGHAACRAVAELPGQAYNPLFIHGNVGLGKTHLLQAVCHAVLDRREPLNVLYLTCEAFANDFLEAVERGALRSFRYRYRLVDVLVIDDIQFLAERERSQEEFFHTFNTLYQSQRQIILSADCPPREITGLEDRLVSRFNSGLVARLDPPCYETRMAIVRKKAELRGISIPDDVVECIAQRISSNIRELEGAITRVYALSQDNGGEMDLDTARRALADTSAPAPAQVSMYEILEAVTAHYQVGPADLQGKKRSRSIALPRQVCMYLGRELTPLSLEEIGSYLGGRDHSTVLYAHRAIKNTLDSSPAVADAVARITEKLTNCWPPHRQQTPYQAGQPAG